MINDWFKFPSSMNLSEDEQAANAERVARAADRVRVVSPPERSSVYEPVIFELAIEVHLLNGIAKVGEEVEYVSRVDDEYVTVRHDTLGLFAVEWDAFKEFPLDEYGNDCEVE